MNPPSAYQLAILNGLQFKHIYEGAVPWRIKMKRRAKNRVARKSRRCNHG